LLVNAAVNSGHSLGKPEEVKEFQSGQKKVRGKWKKDL